MSRFRIVSALGVALMLAACSDSASDPLGPDGPLTNQGLLVGGNRTETDSTAAAPASTFTTSGASVDEDETPPEGGPPPKPDNGGLLVGGN